jgi:hypothetical protein
MQSFKRLGLTLLLVIGLMIPAASMAQQRQAGLVNVAIGDITIQNINVGVAAQVIAALCAEVRVSDVAILANQLRRDTEETRKFACEAQGRDVYLEQSN